MSTESPSYLPAHLTDPQRTAVLHTGSPLLIIAGPGSGKTEVMTWRVVKLIATDKVPPEHILVTTFTRKAAHQLSDRIRNHLGTVNVERPALGIFVGTMHSLCAEILRWHEDQSPLHPGFTILDEMGQSLFVYHNLARLGLDRILKGNMNDFLEAVLRFFNLATDELVQPGQLSHWCEQQKEEIRKALSQTATKHTKAAAKRWESRLRLLEEEELIIDAYSRYRELVIRRGFVDFGMLQSSALDLLRVSPNITEELRKQFREILVDEYQDTSAAQEQILKELAGDGSRLTVVGDDDQSIYRFRGATVRNILGFGNVFRNATVVKLTENFRSREPIVDHSQGVIRNNPSRYPKELFTKRGTGNKVVLVYESSVAEEARSIAGLLGTLHASGTIRKWQDVAILFRSVRNHSNTYIEELISQGIPLQILGKASLFEQAYVRDLCDLLSFLGNAKSWGDIAVRCESMQLATSTTSALEKYAGVLTDLRSINDFRRIGIVETLDVTRLMQLANLKRSVLGKQIESVQKVFHTLLGSVGLVEVAEKEDKIEELLDLGEFSSLVGIYDQECPPGEYQGFLEWLDLLRGDGVDSAVVPAVEAAQVMTIHQAKGLEFPVVVICSVLEGRLPTRRRPEAFVIPEELRASGKREEDEEDPHIVDERKLFYVGATRAKELLVVGTADIVEKRGDGPSRFLTEMLGDNLHEIARTSREKLVAVESGAPPSEPRARLGYGDIAYFLQCPIRYKFASVYGIEPLREDPLGFGANVHRALSRLHHRVLAGEPAAAIDLDDLVRSAWSYSEDNETLRSAQAAAVQQLRRYVAEHEPTFTALSMVDAGFTLEFPGFEITGKVDLVRRRGDGCEIVDFRVGQRQPAADPDTDRQLQFYALGWEASHGIPVVSCVAHYLGSNQLVEFSWNDKLRLASQDLYGTILESIAAGAFAPHHQYCGRCHEYDLICPYRNTHPEGM